MNDIMAPNEDMERMQSCSINDYCRLCANPDDNMVPIYSDDGDDHMLEDKIKTHLPFINISQNDLLPKRICYHCASAVLVWNELHKSSSEADRKLRSMFDISSFDQNQDKSDVSYTNIEGIPESVKNFIGDPIEYEEITDVSIFNKNEKSDKTLNELDKTIRTSKTDSILNHEHKSSVIQEDEQLNSPIKRYNFGYNNGVGGCHDGDDHLLYPRESIGSVKETEPVDDVAATPDGDLTVGMNDMHRCDTCDHLFVNATGLREHQLLEGCLGLRVPDECREQRQPAAAAVVLAESGVRQHNDNIVVKEEVEKNAEPPGVGWEDDDGGTVSLKEWLKEEKNLSDGEEDDDDVCRTCCKTFLGPVAVAKHAEKYVRLDTCCRCSRPLSADGGNHVCDAMPAVNYNNYYCNFCDHKTFVSRDALSQHASTVHGMLPELAGGPTASVGRQFAVFVDGAEHYQCDRCDDYCVRDAQAFHVHYRSHAVVEPYPCDRCTMRFTEINRLRRHVAYAHEGRLTIDKMYACTVCGRRYATKRSVNAHQRTHSSEGPSLFACDKRFMYSSSPTAPNSSVVHGVGNNRRYRCDQCPETFRTRTLLAFHAKRHLD